MERHIQRYKAVQRQRWRTPTEVKTIIIVTEMASKMGPYPTADHMQLRTCRLNALRTEMAMYVHNTLHFQRTRAPVTKAPNGVITIIVYVVGNRGTVCTHKQLITHRKPVRKRDGGNSRDRGQQSPTNGGGRNTNIISINEKPVAMGLEHQLQLRHTTPGKEVLLTRKVDLQSMMTRKAIIEVNQETSFETDVRRRRRVLQQLAIHTHV